MSQKSVYVFLNSNILNFPCSNNLIFLHIEDKSFNPMHTNFHSNRSRHIWENYIFLHALENLFRASALSPCIRCQMSYARAIEHLYFNIFFHLSMKKESESACEILFRLVFIVFCIFFYAIISNLFSIRMFKHMWKEYYI